MIIRGDSPAPASVRLRSACAGRNLPGRKAGRATHVTSGSAQWSEKIRRLAFTLEPHVTRPAVPRRMPSALPGQERAAVTAGVTCWKKQTVPPGPCQGRNCPHVTAREWSPGRPRRPELAGAGVRPCADGRPCEPGFQIWIATVGSTAGVE